MTPAEKAAQQYQIMECDRTFLQDLESHMLHGYVLSNNRCFILCRYVSRNWNLDDMADPDHNPPGNLDCIYMYLAVGDIKEFFTFPHQPVKWVAFSRRGKAPRIYSYDTLKQKIYHGTQQT